MVIRRPPPPLTYSYEVYNTSGFCLERQYDMSTKRLAAIAVHRALRQYGHLTSWKIWSYDWIQYSDGGGEDEPTSSMFRLESIINDYDVHLVDKN